MDQNAKYCPCCGRHCDLSAPHCRRGEEYARTGVIKEGRNDTLHDEHSHHEGHGGREEKHTHEGYGGYEDHRKHEKRGGHEGHGRHDESGARGKHGHHRSRGEKTILGSDRYGQLDTEGKLMALIHELGTIARFGLDGKGSQNRILTILEKEGTITQRALTEQLGIQPGSASEVISKLQRAGLMSRTPSPSDRRTVDLSLTDAGKAFLASRDEKQPQQMFFVLSDEEKSTLLTLLEKLNRSWSKGDSEK